MAVQSLNDRLDGRPRVQRSVRFARDVADEWRDDRCEGLAAEIAFWLVLSIFPGMLVFGALLGLIDNFFGADVADRAEDAVVEAIQDALGSEAGPISNAASDLFNSPSGRALTIGVLVAIFSLSRGFSAVVRALDVAYDIDTQRSWFHGRVTAIMLGIGTVAVGAVTLTTILLGPVFGRSGGLGDWFNTTWAVIGPLVAFAALVAWATTVYHVAPLHQTPWRWDVPGAAVAAVFWLLATFGFRFYVDSAVGGSNAILGTVGAVLTLLLWVYLLSIGLLLGAEINQVLIDHKGIEADRASAGTVRGAVRGRLDRLRDSESEDGGSDTTADDGSSIASLDLPGRDDSEDL